MPRIPHTIRRQGRYYFRRRASWQNGNDLSVVIPLSTCTAQDARSRAAALAAHFDKVKRAVGAYFDLNRTLEPAMLKGLFETELRDCLARLLQEFYDPSKDPQALIDLARTHASAFDLAQRPGVGNELTDAHRKMLSAAGHDESAIEWVACDLDRYCGKETISDEIMALMAEGLDLEATPAVIGRLKSVHLQAQAEAYRLMSPKAHMSLPMSMALIAGCAPMATSTIRSITPLASMSAISAFTPMASKAFGRCSSAVTTASITT